MLTRQSLQSTLTVDMAYILTAMVGLRKYWHTYSAHTDTLVRDTAMYSM